MIIFGSVSAERRRLPVLLPVVVLALFVPGCRPDAPEIETAAVPVERVAVDVTERPFALTLDLRSPAGLSGSQQALVVRFFNAYRARGREAGPVTLAVSAGGPLESAAVEAAADIRQIAQHLGIDAGRLVVVPGPAGARGARLHLSYQIVEVVLPECGYFPRNLARDYENVSHPNKGCAVDRNAAAMIARPQDILGPRGMSPRSAERRDEVWGKYVKGQSTISQKQDGEKLKE